MNKKYIICFAVIFLLITVYVIGYKVGQSWDSDFSFNGSGYYVKEVNAENDSIVKNNAEYVLEVYNNETNENKEIINKIPVEFIGLTREKIIDFIGKNTDFFTDEGEKIQNVMLVSFSEKKVVIRKNIESIEETTQDKFFGNSNAPNYYIFLIDNAVVVYKSDKTTIYMETGITREELDETVAAELTMGVSVKNISDLYRLLESYTS